MTVGRLFARAPRVGSLVFWQPWILREAYKSDVGSVGLATARWNVRGGTRNSYGTNKVRPVLTERQRCVLLGLKLLDRVYPFLNTRWKPRSVYGRRRVARFLVTKKAEIFPPLVVPLQKKKQKNNCTLYTRTHQRKLVWNHTKCRFGRGWLLLSAAL